MELYKSKWCWIPNFPREYRKLKSYMQTKGEYFN